MPTLRCRGWPATPCSVAGQPHPRTCCRRGVTTPSPRRQHPDVLSPPVFRPAPDGDNTSPERVEQWQTIRTSNPISSFAGSLSSVSTMDVSAAEVILGGNISLPEGITSGGGNRVEQRHRVRVADSVIDLPALRCARTGAGTGGVTCPSLARPGFDLIPKALALCPFNNALGRRPERKSSASSQQVRITERSGWI